MLITKVMIFASMFIGLLALLSAVFSGSLLVGALAILLLVDGFLLMEFDV